MPTTTLRVALLRKRHRWTQLQLADRSGMPQGSISKIESGTGGVDLDTLSRLAAAFGVHPGDLLAWDGEPKKPGGKKY
jgi:transcriptional regulator with XRE-family HTH domain